MVNFDRIYNKELLSFKGTGHCVLKNFISKKQINNLISNLDEIISYLSKMEQGSHIILPVKKKRLLILFI